MKNKRKQENIKNYNKENNTILKIIQIIKDVVNKIITEKMQYKNYYKQKKNS